MAAPCIPWLDCHQYKLIAHLRILPRWSNGDDDGLITRRMMVQIHPEVFFSFSDNESSNLEILKHFSFYPTLAPSSFSTAFDYAY